MSKLLPDTEVQIPSNITYLLITDFAGDIWIYIYWDVRKLLTNMCVRVYVSLLICRHIYASTCASVCAFYQYVLVDMNKHVDLYLFFFNQGGLEQPSRAIVTQPPITVAPTARGEIIAHIFFIFIHIKIKPSSTFGLCWIKSCCLMTRIFLRMENKIT